MRRLYLLLALLICSHMAKAQTGPGGVGSASTNTLWLRAGDVAGATGDPVASWPDASASGRTTTQGNAYLQPLLQLNQINGRPVVNFDGVDDRLNIPGSAEQDAFTVFSIVRTDVTHEIDGESTFSTAGTSGQRYLFGATQAGTNGGAGLSVGINGVSFY